MDRRSNVGPQLGKSGTWGKRRSVENQRVGAGPPRAGDGETVCLAGRLILTSIALLPPGDIGWIVEGCGAGGCWSGRC
ncbi:hypothetical protein FHU31_000290 [Mycolicibacterium fluoranthenivorans]|uniref:Uncharacterized protein n=1 Tax=Mycolicibacterium fluoranthenivorans TaxID=258505 RepID=A0A7X5TUS1_9MYCO|nr:hypothetical protein [Mycolicibacterium fluoranthenivorans]